MFAIRGHARTTLLPYARRIAAQRAFATSTPAQRTKTNNPDLHNDIARSLEERGGWRGPRRRNALNKDKKRVNIVSKDLCDDVIEYIRPTLERHKGCDLVDIFPGVGVWSKALSDALQPRSHLLMEPDDKFYRPYLEPLLERPGTRLLPESGIVWEQLNTVLTPDHLPHQVERHYALDETPERNDSLLVTVNLGMHPKRRFRSFESLAQLVLFQLTSAIRPGALFQKYGLVRMLIWAENGEKVSMVPRTIQRRKKLAVEAELSTDHVCEIAGAGEDRVGWDRVGQRYRRDESLDFESTRRALERMRRAGFALPPGREPDHVRALREHVAEHGALRDAGALAGAYSVDRPFLAELEQLSADFEAGKLAKDSPEYRRLRTVRYLQSSTARRWTKISDLMHEYQAAVAAHRAAGEDEARRGEAAALCQAWSDKVAVLDRGMRAEVMLQRDNLHALLADPPILNWDKRYVEPLQVRADEFYPQVPLALLDVQPKATAPVLRDMGPLSTRGGDTFDLLLRSLLHSPAEGVAKVLDDMAPGGADGIVPHCPSLTDPDRGGVPVRGFGQISPRILGDHHFVEIAEAWMKWPFRPTYPELVMRTVDNADLLEEDITGNTSTTE